MYEFDDGTTAEQDKINLKLIINNPHNGKFTISGFKNSQEMEIFVNFGDFKNSSDNDFYICTGSKTKLEWTNFEQKR